MYISVEELQFLNNSRRLDESVLKQYFPSPIDCIRFLLEEYPQENIEDLKNEIRSLEHENSDLEDTVYDLEKDVSNLESEMKMLEKRQG